MIAIVDYGMGNVASVTTAFQKLGYEIEITDSVERLKKSKSYHFTWCRIL